MIETRLPSSNQKIPTENVNNDVIRVLCQITHRFAYSLTQAALASQPKIIYHFNCKRKQKSKEKKTTAIKNMVIIFVLFCCCCCYFFRFFPILWSTIAHEHKHPLDAISSISRVKLRPCTHFIVIIIITREYGAERMIYEKWDDLWH